MILANDANLAAVELYLFTQAKNVLFNSFDLDKVMADLVA